MEGYVDKDSVASMRAALQAHGLHNLAKRSDEEVWELFEGMRLAKEMEDNPQGDPQTRAAYLAGRKWAIKTAKKHGVDAIPIRVQQALASKPAYTPREVAHFMTATVDAAMALGEGREPPMARVTIN
jgi:hypothetical protein